mgnify:CR=1 FL=1
MKKSYFLRALVFIFCIAISASGIAQDADSTAVKEEYPYILPILGKKAYEKGHRLQLPFGFSVSTLFNKQGIILDNFSMAFTQNDEVPDFERLQPISDLIVFGPSDGRINTLNFRFDTWLLPFFNVGGYYGRVWGEQTVTLTAPINLESVTDITGQYYGFNLLGVVPVGPVVLSADYSWSWTTNERLDKPVLVEVSGIRVIKRFLNKRRPDRFWAVWAGAQFQKLDNQTSGKIDLKEALNIEEGSIDELDNQWDAYKMTPAYEDLPAGEKIRQEAAYQIIRGAVVGLAETTVHYKFEKRLEHEWNMVLGGNYQFNDHWQARLEYGFLQSKQQVMLMMTYRFGL